MVLFSILFKSGVFSCAKGPTAFTLCYHFTYFVRDLETECYVCCSYETSSAELIIQSYYHRYHSAYSDAYSSGYKLA